MVHMTNLKLIPNYFQFISFRSETKMPPLLTFCITEKLNCRRHGEGVMVHSHLRSIMPLRLRLLLTSRIGCEPIFAIAIAIYPVEKFAIAIA